MSCLGSLILPQVAAISGLPAERLEQMADTARRKPLPPLPLDPEVVNAVLAGLPASHDRKQGTAVLQLLAQGLRLALRQSRDRPSARNLALLTALTGTPLPDIPIPDPALVQEMRADLLLRPAPLPLTLPNDPDVRRRAVLAAARIGPWTDDEAGWVAPDPALAGLAWALGVRHPRIRAVVEQSLDAAVAAMRAGATDPDLLQRVATNETPSLAANVLATTLYHDPRLIAAAAVNPSAAATVLANRPDLTDPALLAAATRDAEAAATVLANRPDLTDPALLAAAAREAWPAAMVLAARPDLVDLALLRAAAREAWAAAMVLANRPDLTNPDLIAQAAEWADTAAEVLANRPDLTDPALLRAAAQEADEAAKVLAARSDITDPDLIAAAAQKSWPAAKVLAARSDITDPDLIAAAAQESWPAAWVLANRPDLADPDLIIAATWKPWDAAIVLANRPDLTDPVLLRAAAQEANAAAEVLAKRRDIADSALIARAAAAAGAAATVLANRRDITDPDLIAAAARAPEPAATVLANRRDIADPDLIRAAMQEAKTALHILMHRPDLSRQRDTLAQIGGAPTVAHAVVDMFGPYPALWQALPAPLQNEIADRYRMTPSERAWLAELAIRTPPAWTDTDDQMAARFPWHAALRDRLRHPSVSDESGNALAAGHPCYIPAESSLSASQGSCDELP